jgi:hypothetical protein
MASTNQNREFHAMQLMTVMLFLLAISGSASATLTSLNGDGFTATYDDANLGFFLAPTLSGDGKTILFSPLDYRLVSSGSSSSSFGTQFATSSIQLDITPYQNQQMTGLSIIENGDYRLVDRNISAISSKPNVDVFGVVRLLNLSNNTDNIAYNFSTDIEWTACSSANCPAVQWAINEDFQTPDWGSVAVRLILENTLMAEAFEIGDFAFIEKKHASQTISITPMPLNNLAAVPLPMSGYLFAIGLISIGVLRKRIQKGQLLVVSQIL